MAGRSPFGSRSVNETPECAAAPEPVTPAQLRLSVERRLRSATAAGFGSPLLTQRPEVTAEKVMDVVTPVLEARDREIARLRARVAELEALARDMDRYEPYPREGSGYKRPALPVGDETVARWRAVLGGEGE